MSRFHVPLQADFLPVYQQQLKDMIISQVDKQGPGRDRPLEELKVVVNAGNGMGGFLADTLEEVRKLYCLSDWGGELCLDGPRRY